MSCSLSLGISPCPNDTFIFHALLHGLTPPAYPEEVTILPHIADVEDLNRLALAGELAVSKISVGAIPHILDKYMLLGSGAALGFGCGPIIVAKSANANPSSARIATPGKMTTASLLLDLHGGFKGERKNMLFSDIIPAIVNGEAEMGIIIHEGRFTYHQYNLCKILDMGQWWENKFNMPLPLGAIAVRRDIDRSLALAMQAAIEKSIDYARANPCASRDFVALNARELSEGVIKAHIDTFVTAYSKNLREEGRAAIRQLLTAAAPRQQSRIDYDLFIE